MLSTLIFDECSVQTMLRMKQFANQRFTPNGLLILARDFLSFFRMCEVETKLFHTWWDLDPNLRSKFEALWAPSGCNPLESYASEPKV